MVVVVVYLSIYLSVCLSSVCLSTCKLENEAILRETSCKLENEAIPRETSSVFELDNVKNEAILRQSFKLATSKTKQFCETVFSSGKLSAELTAWYHCILRFFQSMSLKYCACHEKVKPAHTKCCASNARSS